MKTNFMVAWSTGSKHGWHSNFRTFDNIDDAERFYDALNLRPDCYEGYLTEVKDNLHQ
jgi:hypothetical protein